VLGDFGREPTSSSSPWRARTERPVGPPVRRTADVGRRSGLPLRDQPALRLDRGHVDPRDPALRQGTDQQTYERFDTEQLADSDALLKRFVFLLGAAAWSPRRAAAISTICWPSRSGSAKDLTKGFYLRYADMREDAFERLCRDNPEASRHDVLQLRPEAARSGCCSARFARSRAAAGRDHPQGVSSIANPYPAASDLGQLPRAVPFESTRATRPWASTPTTAGCSPTIRSWTARGRRRVCAHFREVGDFDYRPAHQAAFAPAGKMRDCPIFRVSENGTVPFDQPASASGAKTHAVPVPVLQASLIDVDILGHIFEQSITDLEKLRNELDGLAEPRARRSTRRAARRKGRSTRPRSSPATSSNRRWAACCAIVSSGLRQGHESAAKPAARARAGRIRGFNTLDKLKKPSGRPWSASGKTAGRRVGLRAALGPGLRQAGPS